jgi:type II secretion system protein N
VRLSSSARRRALRGLGYGAFVLGVFLVALWWLLPYPEIARNVESRLLSQGVTVRIEGLGPATFPGVRARRVRLAPGEGSEWGLDLHEARVSVPLLALARGDAALGIQALTLGGDVRGRVSLSQSPKAAVSWHRLDLSRLRLPAALSELPLSGSASGQLDVALQPNVPIQSEGRTELTFQDVRIGAGKAMGFPVPAVWLGNGRLRLSAEGGKLDVESAVFEGGDLAVELTGSILLRPDTSRSLVNGMLSLRPDERVSRELALLFAVFPGARASDGRHTARIRGTLGAPRLLPR